MRAERRRGAGDPGIEVGGARLAGVLSEEEAGSGALFRRREHGGGSRELTGELAAETAFGIASWGGIGREEW